MTPKRPTPGKAKPNLEAETPKIYECKKCNYPFTRKIDLERHNLKVDCMNSSETALRLREHRLLLRVRTFISKVHVHVCPYRS